MRAIRNLPLIQLARDARARRDTPLIVLINGRNGRGKSRQARLTVRWMRYCNRLDPHNWFTAAIVQAFDLENPRASLLSLFASARGFDERSEAAHARLLEFIGADLLIIDELTADGKRGQTFNESLASLLDARMKKFRPTWIITNNNSADILESFGARNFSRIVSAAHVVTFTGSDLRRKS